MSAILKINATRARRELFHLIDKVSSGNLTVVIEKKNSSIQVAITPFHEIFGETKAVRGILSNELFGSLKPRIPYRKDEVAVAHKVYFDKFSKKYKK